MPDVQPPRNAWLEGLVQGQPFEVFADAKLVASRLRWNLGAILVAIAFGLIGTWLVVDSIVRAVGGYTIRPLSILLAVLVFLLFAVGLPLGLRMRRLLHLADHSPGRRLLSLAGSSVHILGFPPVDWRDLEAIIVADTSAKSAARAQRGSRGALSANVAKRIGNGDVAISFVLRDADAFRKAAGHSEASRIVRVWAQPKGPNKGDITIIADAFLDANTLGSTRAALAQAAGHFGVPFHEAPDAAAFTQLLKSAVA